MKVSKRRPPADGSWRVVAPDPRPLYVYRPLAPATAAALRAWALGQGFSTTLDPADLHVTICYSKEPVDVARVDPAEPYVRVPYGGPRSIEQLGDEGAVVLRFESPELERRWTELRYAGASWDFERYNPHVTISYTGAPADLARIVPFADPLLFEGEVFKTIEGSYSPPIEKARRRPPTGPKPRRPRALRRAELSAARELDAATRLLEPRLARAFVEAASALRNSADVRAIAAALAAGRYEDAVRLTGVDALAERLRGSGLEPGAPTFVDSLLGTLRAGGAAGMRALPRATALAASLDLTNPEAVRYLATTLPERIKYLTDASREAVRATLEAGFREGRPTVEMARELRAVLGLTPSQAEAVRNFRRQLLSGELGTATAPWDRRLSAADASHARAVFSRSTPPTAARVDGLVDRYSVNLLNRRARDVARTESTRAFGAGQTELWRQAAEQGLLDPARIRRFWVVTPDDRLRPEHAEVPDLNPDGVGLDEPFDTPVGPVMAPRESGDPSFDVNCRCTVALGFGEPE